MTPELILWGIPGAIALYFIALARPTRAKSGWDFVVQVAFLAALCYTVARLLVATSVATCPVVADWVRPRWFTLFPPPYSFNLAVGIFPVAPVVGYFIARLTPWWLRRMSGLASSLSGRERNFEFADVFFATMHDLLGETVLISLKSGKVYVGVLTDATADPNEDDRFLKIQPAMSGYREEPTKRVIFTTLYEDVTDTSVLALRGLLLPVAELQSIAPFDNRLFLEFLDKGATEVRPFEASEGDSAG